MLVGARKARKAPTSRSGSAVRVPLGWAGKAGGELGSGELTGLSPGGWGWGSRKDKHPQRHRRFPGWGEASGAGRREPGKGWAGLPVPGAMGGHRLVPGGTEEARSRLL